MFEVGILVALFPSLRVHILLDYWLQLVYVFPSGPIQMFDDGYAWWNVNRQWQQQMIQQGKQEDVLVQFSGTSASARRASCLSSLSQLIAPLLDDMKKSQELIIGLIRSLQAGFKFPFNQVVIGGFSQVCHPPISLLSTQLQATLL